jgi:nucleotide-binding universal stress UspA family protein
MAMTQFSSELNDDQPVLVAIDFSHDSKAALEWACKYADMSGSKLILLHIVHDQASNPGFYKKGPKNELKPMQAVAETMMADFIEEIKTENPELVALESAELQFIAGLPPTRIVEVSKLLNATLIVMGSRGITGLPHKLLGSVAERVVELSKIPVVVVKATEIPEPKKKEIKRQLKQKKKDRQWLKDKLGLGKKPKVESDADG